MSGGYWNYENDSVAREIFGWSVDAPSYDLANRQESAKLVAKENPLEDFEISELAYDLFCLLHSYDWYKSGDTTDETYFKDVQYFKNKWLSSTMDDRIDRLTELAKSTFNDLKDEYVNCILRGCKKEDSK